MLRKLKSLMLRKLKSWGWGGRVVNVAAAGHYVNLKGGGSRLALGYYLCRPIWEVASHCLTAP